MVCYTCVGILACTYVGCCDAAGATWQTFAGRAVPTVLGVVWGMLVTSLILPQYVANDLLREQAGILRSSYATLLSMYHEERAATIEGRPSSFSRQLAAMEATRGAIVSVETQVCGRVGAGDSCAL